MTALGDARTAVAAALASVGVPVHILPPQALQPPCLVLLPGSPWRDRAAGTVQWDVVLYANPAGGNAAAITTLEGLEDGVVAGLTSARIRFGNTEPPATEIDAGVLSARIPTTSRYC